ncbi:MAG: hypothetical protein O2783_08200, partial [Chloroflexi bacterium]|nr:hypothetical protein [Chloroflexota bacterium]
MIVLTGDSRSHAMVAALQGRGWGRMFVGAKPTPYPGEPWGLDNGAYADHLKGRRLDVPEFRIRAERATETGGCIMAVLPDIVGGGEESLDLSMAEIDRLPALPWYLAVQDGMHLQPLWGRVCEALKDERIKGVFLGGTNRFKLTARTWRHTADMRDKKL